MSQNKTKPTEVSVEEFIRKSDPKKIEDSFELVKIMERLSGEPATMWGPSIIGFGKYHYKYASGREGDMCRIGFPYVKLHFHSIFCIATEKNPRTNFSQNWENTNWETEPVFTSRNWMILIRKFLKN